MSDYNEDVQALADLALDNPMVFLDALSDYEEKVSLARTGSVHLAQFLESKGQAFAARSGEGLYINSEALSTASEVILDKVQGFALAGQADAADTLIGISILLDEIVYFADDLSKVTPVPDDAPVDSE